MARFDANELTRRLCETQRQAEQQLKREIDRVNRANQQAVNDHNRKVAAHNQRVIADRNARVRNHNRKVDAHNQKVIANLNRQLRSASSSIRYTEPERRLADRVHGAVAAIDTREYDSFLSYARIDGTDVAADLRSHLESLGVAVWFDEVAIVPGRSQALQMDAVVATDEEGHPQIATCGEMRIFRFSCDYPNPDVDALSVLLSQCKDGPFGKANVEQSIHRIQKWGETITGSVSQEQGKDKKSPLSPWVELKVLHLDKFVTAYLFGVILVGHGVGFIPTGVLVDTREPTTIVAQLAASQGIPHDAGPLIQHLEDRPGEALEALMKGVYQTQKR